jgi:aspartate ammonia-lyase
VPDRPRSRIERDELGELALPVDALYGIHTARSLENLRFSRRALGGCPAYLHALLRVKRAAARANAEAGVIERRIAEAIECAALTLEAGAHADQFPVDLLGGGGSIGVHMNVNEVLAKLANAKLEEVSASQSTADVCHSAARLAIRALARPLDAALASAVTTLGAKSVELAPVRTLARTCLRDALPVSASVLVAGWAGALARARSSLEDAVANLDALALGGTVIGTGDGAPASYRARVVEVLAELEARPLTRRGDPCDALQNGDDLLAVSHATVSIANALLKIGQDLRLLSSGPEGGFAELELPHVQAGSSFFAGKSNPVVPETAIACALQVIGLDRSVQAAVERAELHLHVFDGFAAANVFEALELETNAVTLLDTRCLRGLRANVARCEALAGTTSAR